MGRPGDVKRAIRLSMGGEPKRFVRPGDDPCDPGSSELRLKRKERKHGLPIFSKLTVKDMTRYVKMHDIQLRQILKGNPGFYDTVKKIQMSLMQKHRALTALDDAIAAHDREVRT